MSDNLKHKTIAAIKWSAVDRIGQQLLQLIVSILLARRLAVDVFGLIAMLAVFNALSSVLIDSGFGQALIRKKTEDEREFSTIFLFNIFVGITLYALLFTASPYIARFYDTPELTKVARVVFITIPLNALYLIPFVKLSMKLDFKSISQVNLIATALSGIIAISLAFSGFEVWAIVWQMVSYHLFRFVIFYIFVKWRPLLSFSFDYIREHWRFSINLLGTSSLNAIFNNIFTFIFGKFYSTTTLGHYYQANKQAETVNYTFMSIFTSSSFNVFSQIQQDLPRLRRVLKEFISKVAIFIIPVGVFLIFSAEDLIVTLIKDKWLPAVPYFQLIVAANLVAPLYQLQLNALNSRGLSRLTFRIELFKKGLILLAVFALVRFGALTMIAAYTLISWISYAVVTYFGKRKIEYKLHEQIKDLLPAFVVALIVGAATMLLSRLQLPHLPSLLVKSAVAVLFYLLTIKLAYNDIYEKVMAELRRIFK